MADLDRKDAKEANGNYTAQSENKDSVNISNYDANDYQPYLHDDGTQSSTTTNQGTQSSTTDWGTQSNNMSTQSYTYLGTQSTTNSQTQETVVEDKSQYNNYNPANYSDWNMNLSEGGFETEGKQTDTYREETAAEIAAPVTLNRRETSADTNAGAKEGGGAIGLSALALSILSLFVFPVLFGGAGIILGFIARGRGSSAGTWAITIGAISLILGIFILPFF